MQGRAVLCLRATRQQLEVQQRWTSTSRVLRAKEDMSTDKQEDSSADAGALKDSRETAQRTDNVDAESPHSSGAEGEARFDPEVVDKSGSGFPHQTAADRKSRLATSTEGEAGVKTREYTPKEGTKLYDKQE